MSVRQIDESNPFGNRAPKRDDPDLLRRRSTMAGMASWGGEGPVGSQCYMCHFWGYERHRTDGTLPSAPCRKYAGMANISPQRAPPIPPTQASCKYFDWREPALPRFKYK